MEIKLNFKELLVMIGITFLGTTMSFGQGTDSTKSTLKGRWLIETNTGFGGIQPANTGMVLKVTNGTALWNIGGEAGYFVTNRLAIKLGLGFGNLATGASATNTGGESGSAAGEAGEGGSSAGEAGEGGSTGGAAIPGSGGSAIAGLGTILSYKVGAKYYLLDRIPFQIDVSGINVSNYNFELGFQGGYAFFLGEKKNISIEPGLRYSLPLQSNPGTINNMFQANVGFSIFF
jgi:hypothetical protein